MKSDAVILILLLGCCLAVYGVIFYYAWQASKEKARRVEAEIKVGEDETDKEIDSLSVADLVKRANKRDGSGKG